MRIFVCTHIFTCVILVLRALPVGNFLFRWHMYCRKLSLLRFRAILDESVESVFLIRSLEVSLMSAALNTILLIPCRNNS